MNPASQQVTVTLTAENKTGAAFQTVDKSLAGLDSRVAALATRFAGPAILGGLSGIAIAINKTTTELDRLGKDARAAGLAAKDFAGLGISFEQAGGRSESLTKAVGRLNVELGRARAGAMEQGALFKQMGVDLDGTTRQALERVADHFQKINIPADRAMVAAKLFGEEAGPRMAEMLSVGGIEMGRAIDRFGEMSGVTDEATRAAAELRGQLDLLGERAAGTGRSLASPFIKALVDATFWSDRASARFGQLRGVLEGFKSLGKSAFVDMDPLNRSMRESAQAFDDLFAAKNRAREAETALSAASGRGVTGAELLPFKMRLDAARADMAKAEAALQEWTRLERKITAKLAAESRLSNLPPTSSIAVATTPARARAIVLDVIDPFASQRRQAELEAIKLVADEESRRFELAMEIEDQRVAGDTRAALALRSLREQYVDLIDPVEQYRRKLDGIDTLVDAGALSGDLAAAARLKVHEQIDALGEVAEALRVNDDLANRLGLTFQSAFEDAVIAGRGLRDTLEALGADISRIFLRRMVTEPLGGALSNLFAGINFGGARAAGGPVRAGSTYLVGEHGPELYTASAAGMIWPHDVTAPVLAAPRAPCAIPAAGRGLTINGPLMVVQTADAASFKRSSGQIKSDLLAAVRQAAARHA